MHGLSRVGPALFRARFVLVFLIAFTALAGVAGKKALTKPSGANHFVHLASGWLEGRTHLEGKPPGYKKRAHDDWAQVYTLELRDGSTLRAYPCKTEGCRQFKRETGEETWWSLSERRWIDIERRAIKKRKTTWYVSFPPGPAALMLPGVAIWGMSFWDVLFTAFIASLIPVFLVRLLDHARGTEDGRAQEHLWAAAAWTVASPAFFLGSLGRVWFTAQIVAALFMVLYLSASWGSRRPALAGLWLGMAMTCRPHLAFAIVFFALEWWRSSRRPMDLVRFALPFGLLGLALGLHNMVRFESFFEFGHRFLDIRWQARIQDHGLFSTIYLSRNLQCLFTLLPQFHGAFPFMRISLHGTALAFTTPWLICLFWARERFAQRPGLWLAAAVVAIPTLFYQNSGQTQYTYRFAVDWLPMVLLALVMGGGAKRRLFPVLVVVGALLHVYCTWLYAHQLNRLLVLDPLGWPFESELL